MISHSNTITVSDRDGPVANPIKVRPSKDTKDDDAVLEQLVSGPHGSFAEDIAAGGLNTEALKSNPDAIRPAARALGCTLDDSRHYPWGTLMGAAGEMRKAVPDLRQYVTATAELLEGIKMNKRNANSAAGVAFIVTACEEVIDCGDADLLRSVNCCRGFPACIRTFGENDFEYGEAIYAYLEGLMARMRGDRVAGAAYCLFAASWMELDESLFGTGLRTRNHLKDLALKWVEAADLSI